MIWRTYIAFFSIVLITSVGSKFIISDSIQRQSEDSKLINLAGRQRMLSQKISKIGLLIFQGPTEIDRSIYRLDLKKLLIDWEAVHHGLINGNTSLGLPGENSEKVIQYFEEIDPYFQNMMEASSDLLNHNNDADARAESIGSLLKNEASFLKIMDKIVFQYDTEAKAKLDQLKWFADINHALLIIVVLLELIFIIRPVLRYLKKKTRALKQVNKDLEQKNETLNEKNEEINLQNQNYLQINKALVQAKERAEAAAVTKAQFLSNMSHEIRTPMNAVVGLTNILLDAKPREDQLENLNTLKFSADNLLAIINDILDLSKIEEGKIIFEQVEFDLQNLVYNIQSTLMLKAENKGLNLEVSLADEVPKMLIGDPVRLSQILLNLINNAIKFTDEGGVFIKISLRKMVEEEAMLFFEVIDTGIGIPKEKQKLIFDSFTQADANTTRLFGGTGLGLTITKKLIEMQGGIIGVDSVFGEGSRFYFSILYKKSKNLFPKASQAIKLIKHYSTASNKRILLVEDYKINQMVAGKFFEKWNMEFDIANNGLEAIQMVQSNDYGLILMDLQMPEMDGYEATKVIRRMKNGLYQNLPIVALSASAMLEIKQRALDIGMNDFVSKPFRPKELFNAISRFVHT